MAATASTAVSSVNEMTDTLNLRRATQADYRPSKLQTERDLRQGPVAVADSDQAESGARDERVACLADPGGDRDGDIGVRLIHSVSGNSPMLMPPAAATPRQTACMMPCFPPHTTVKPIDASAAQRLRSRYLLGVRVARPDHGDRLPHRMTRSGAAAMWRLRRSIHRCLPESPARVPNVRLTGSKRRAAAS